MRDKFVTIVGTKNGRTVELCPRQPVDSWIEVDGHDITMHLISPSTEKLALGPVKTRAAAMQLAFFLMPKGGKPIATVPIKPLKVGTVLRLK